MSAQNQDGNNEQKRCSKALKAVKVEEKPKEEWAEDLEAKFLRQEGYEIKGKLGQGGSGKVYVSINPLSSIKLLRIFCIERCWYQCRRPKEP